MLSTFELSVVCNQLWSKEKQTRRANARVKLHSLSAVLTWHVRARGLYDTHWITTFSKVNFYHAVQNSCNFLISFYISWLDLPQLDLSRLYLNDLSSPNLTCPNWTCPNLNCPSVTCPYLTSPSSTSTLTCPNLIHPDLNSPYLTCTVPT